MRPQFTSRCLASPSMLHTVLSPGTALTRDAGPKAISAAAVTHLTAGTLRGLRPNSRHGRIAKQDSTDPFSSRVSVIDASAGHIITTLPLSNVFELGFSPLGTYLITWQRPSKDEDGNASKNLKVWRTVSEDAEDDGSRAVVGEYVQRNQTGWNLQYTSDEKFCARVVNKRGPVLPV